MEGTKEFKDFILHHGFNLSHNHSLNDQNQLNSNDGSFHSLLLSDDVKSTLLDMVKNEPNSFDTLDFGTHDNILETKKRRRELEEYTSASLSTSSEEKKKPKKKGQLTVTETSNGACQLETEYGTFVIPIPTNISNGSLTKLPAMNQSNSSIDTRPVNLPLSIKGEDRATLFKQEFKQQAMTWNNNNPSRSNPITKTPSLVQHPTNSSLLVGSCHQCKRRREISIHTLCRSKRGTKHCKLKYCEVCLRNHYPQIVPSDEDIINNTVEWICPKCRGICHCVSCKRNTEKKTIILTDKTPEGNGLKFSHPDLQRLTNMIQASGVHIVQCNSDSK